MSNDRNREYLETKVTTASPAQLHLMLIEGAMRFGREAEKAMRRDDQAAAAPYAMRTLEIVEELIAGVRHSQDDINVKMARLYEFVFSRCTSAYVNSDCNMMDEALTVLEYQRDTWRMACEKVVTEGAQAKPATEGHKKPAAPHINSAPVTEGLTLEA